MNKTIEEIITLNLINQINLLIKSGHEAGLDKESAIIYIPKYLFKNLISYINENKIYIRSGCFERNESWSNYIFMFKYKGFEIVMGYDESIVMNSIKKESSINPIVRTIQSFNLIDFTNRVEIFKFNNKFTCTDLGKLHEFAANEGKGALYYQNGAGFYCGGNLDPEDFEGRNFDKKFKYFISEVGEKEFFENRKK